MIYGHKGTWHQTERVNVELDADGKVVSVWFRCMAIPFDQRVVGEERANDMRRMSETINTKYRLLAVDIDLGDE